MKAAGHELRGAISTFHAIEDENENAEGSDVNLQVNLTAIIDHLGFRVQVMTLLDLGKGSLKVGSGDACCSVPHGNLDETERVVNTDMCAVARRMGLAVHEVRVGDKTVQLGFGADVEAHLDAQGIGRVLDTARVFPPEDYMSTTWKKVETVGRVLLPEELCRDRVVMAARGKKKTMRRATVVKPSTKKGKDGQWVVKFDKDGKSFATPVEEIHLLEVKKVARSNAVREAFLPSAKNNMSIFWRLLRPELLTLLKDYDYDDGLGEKGLSSDAFSLFAEKGSDSGKHDARIRVATEFLMAVQVPKVAKALVDRPTNQWWNGAELTGLFHGAGVNMRHAGAVWSLLNEKCNTQFGGEEDAELDEDKSANSARRAVVQEMYVRSAKNLLRRDLRGAMELGAGAHEIEQIVSKTFTHMSPGDDESDAYLGRIWEGVEQRFGVKKIETQLNTQQCGSVSAIRAVQRVAASVGVRLTQSCLGDLAKALVKSETEASRQRGGRGTSKRSSGFTFTAADIEGMTPRVKFLDTDDYAQGVILQKQALAEAVKEGLALSGDDGDCLVRNDDTGGEGIIDAYNHHSGKHLITFDDVVIDAQHGDEHADEQKVYAAETKKDTEASKKHRHLLLANMTSDWYNGRGRILAQCDAKFTAARATYGRKVGEGQNQNQAIASIRVARVECLCLGGAATDTAAERRQPGVGWEARMKEVRAFAAIAAIEGDREQSAAELMVEPTVALFKMLYDAKMADVAWEEVEAHVLRSMTSKGKEDANADMMIAEGKSVDREEDGARTAKEKPNLKMPSVAAQRWSRVRSSVAAQRWSRVRSSIAKNKTGKTTKCVPARMNEETGETKDDVVVKGHSSGIEDAGKHARDKQKRRGGKEDGEETGKLKGTRGGEDAGTHVRLLLARLLEIDPYANKLRARLLSEVVSAAKRGAEDAMRWWDAEKMRPASMEWLIEGHGSGVWSVAWSPGGSTIASGSKDGTVRVWDAATGQQSQDGAMKGGLVNSVVFSPDGSKIASGVEEKMVRVWDAGTGQQVSDFGPLEGHSGWVNSVAWSPDGSKIASGSDDKTVRVWDATTGQHVIGYGPLKGHGGPVYSVAWSPDGSKIASGSRDKTVWVWDTSTGQPVAEYGPLKGHSDHVRSVAWSPDGSKIASGGQDKMVRVWDSATGQHVTEYGPLKGHGDGVRSVAWSPDGSKIASGSNDQTIRMWNAATGQPVTEYGPMKGHRGGVWSVAWSPDGSKIASGSTDSTVRIWDAATGEPPLDGPLVHQGTAVPVEVRRLLNETQCLKGQPKTLDEIIDAVTIKSDAALEKMRSAISSHDRFNFQWASRNVGMTMIDDALENGETTLLKLAALTVGGNATRFATMLIANNADVNAQKNGKSSLFLAAENGNSALARVLANNGADASLVAAGGETPLHAAAAVVGGHVGMLSLLAGSRNGEVNRWNNNGKTPLFVALENGRWDNATCLVEQCNADMKQVAKEASEVKYATDIFAAVNQHASKHAYKMAVEEEEAALEDMEVFEKNTDEWFAAEEVYIATKSKCAEKKRTLEIIIINEEELCLETLLDVAASKGHLNVVKWLVEEGKADINQADENGKSLLYFAAMRDDAKVAAWLVGEGHADANQADSTGWTPLYIAAWKGHNEVASLLVQEGKADINQANKNGRTPLYIAARECHIEVAALLVKEDQVNINQASNDGETPLYIAAEKGNVKVVELLLNEGKADVNQTDDKGKTPLLRSIEMGNITVATLLVKEGQADVTQEDAFGGTALNAAASRGYTELAMLLVVAAKKDAGKQKAKEAEKDADAAVAKTEGKKEDVSQEHKINMVRVMNEKLQTTWFDMELSFKPHKETDTFVMVSPDDIQELLDDSITTVHAMKCSPNARQFLEDGDHMNDFRGIGPFEKQLTFTQDLLELWIQCQCTWVWLDGLFDSPDIRQQLPTEADHFNTTSQSWKHIMAQAARDKRVLEVIQIEDILDRFKELSNSLDHIEKSLTTFLEEKRLSFPRLFFVSNDELFGILSQNRDPRAVQQHLGNIFEGINSLTFDDDFNILELKSRGKEVVKLNQSGEAPINPGGCAGVEVWLAELEVYMRRAVHDAHVAAMLAYEAGPRVSRGEWEQWVTGTWLGQVVLVVSQMFWTMEVEHSIRTAGAAGITDYIKDEMNPRLTRIVELVQGKLTKEQRITIGALVGLEVHARDTLNDMVDTVNDVQDFGWTKQLRYYYEPKTENEWGQDGLVVARMLKSRLPCYNEYLGNVGRLVQTPLTDRCCRALIGACYHNVGGAPQGPAGTGKTETVKDLAKALALQCIVFNCSDQIDHRAMGKIFTGLVGAGAWGCFDEFNRINLEVMSVVSMQIQTIQDAKKLSMERRTTDCVMFEGTNIKIRSSFNIFITMNPGYAGRYELPDNLKVLFRPVAMMRIDLTMVSEVILMVHGYIDARKMGRKICAALTLCSEQLSSQYHYDYGMRTLITVTKMLGTLKLQYPDNDESVLVLRALKQTISPKLLDNDLFLFDGVLLDLFKDGGESKVESKAESKEEQGGEAADIIYALTENAPKRRLQPTDYFIKKCIGIYEMLRVRHGLMLVGLPFGGKTESYRVLAAALGDMSRKGQGGEIAKVTHTVVINPKSVTLGQLYGSFDPESHEWTNGIVANTFRNMAHDGDDGTSRSGIVDNQWLVLDGPIDAVWAENMNTVLDDNKRLCLNSGEIITMSPTMKMLFETMDLSFSSPATISRCGIVYFEPHLVSWRPLFASWLSNLPRAVQDSEKNRLRVLFDGTVDKLLEYLRQQLKELVPCENIALVQGAMRLVSSLIAERSAGLGEEEAALGMSAEFIEFAFTFSIMWSVCASVDEASRFKMSNKVVEILESLVACPFPRIGSTTCYDFSFKENAEGKFDWVAWEDTLSEFTIPPAAAFHQIIVPTKATAQMMFLCDLLVKNKVPVLFVGPTGTGKSAYCRNVLCQDLPPDKFVSLTITLSAQTTAQQAQSQIDSKLLKRRKRHYGPAAGKTMVIFIDDLNMPVLSEYGSQPPLELLRQFADHGGGRLFRFMGDVLLMACMGPTGGGRNTVSPRLLRHFNTICVPEFDDATILKIFNTIVAWHFDGGEDAEMQEIAIRSVAASLQVYREVAEKNKPTPACPHYVFNLRDVSRVVSGMLLVPKADYILGEGGEPARCGPSAFVASWAHECMRVFCDRLRDKAEVEDFQRHILSLVQECFHCSPTEVFAELKQDRGGDEVSPTELRQLLFCDFGDPENAGKPYRQIVGGTAGTHRLVETVEIYLQMHNNEMNAPMDLVIFLFAVEHLSRISRVLRTPGGNMLLVGVGGSGRQSMTTLATYMAGHTLFRVEISKVYDLHSFREDMKLLLRMAGTGDNDTVFLFSDTQIKDETFVEDINCMLSTGEVPNLFNQDERSQIADEMRAVEERKGNAAAEKMESELFSLFVGRVKVKLHIAICLSPTGVAFRTRLRNFPSLVNCCTIDWFQAWPDDALRNVASRFLDNTDLDDELKESCVVICQHFHANAREVSQTFLKECRRFSYVTPTSFLELLKTFSSVLGEQREIISKARKRYTVGLEKLSSAASQVAGMREELSALMPVLETTLQEVSEITGQIDEKRRVVKAIEGKVSAEAATTDQAKHALNAIKQACEEALAEAMPAVHAAEAALDTVHDEDLASIKDLANPPAGIRMVLKAVCIMMGISPVQINDPEGGDGKIDDYWEPSQELLGQADLLSRLKGYDRDNIQAKTITNLRENCPEFALVNAKKESDAAMAMCTWVLAMDEYGTIVNSIALKRAELTTAEATYAAMMVDLTETQAECVEAQKILSDHDAAVTKKESLEQNAAMCKAKLSQASSLIDSLGGEKDRWTAAAQHMELAIVNLSGDVILSSGMLAYLGVFTPTFRKQTFEAWSVRCRELDIPCSETCSLMSVLGDPAKVRDWNIRGLPKDTFSTENGIMMHACRRWPLLIDPQGQANKFVRNLEENNSLHICKLADKSYLRTLENAVQFGQPVLLENVGEELGAAIEPLLRKNVVKTAGSGGFVSIRLGDSTIEWSDDFRLYITTSLRNPHYLPETAVKVTLINFMITPDGLGDQLLGIVVAQERPELERANGELIVQGAANKRKLEEIENEVLHILSASEGNILDDESVIKTLASSKTVSDNIKKEQAVGEKTMVEIFETRRKYKHLSDHTTTLFFCITDLAYIDSMYQYSLSWFVALFIRSIQESPAADTVEERLVILRNAMTELLYANICRSLFEEDKLTFSFLICLKVMEGDGKIATPDLRFLLTGMALSDVTSTHTGMSLSDADEVPPNPDPTWIQTPVWLDLHRLSAIPALSGICGDVAAAVPEWRALYESSAPHTTPMPASFEQRNPTDIHRLVVLRALRPDKLVPAIVNFIGSQMGQRYTEPPQFDLAVSYHESTTTMPLIFLLSPGSDPTAELYTFAQQMHMQTKIDSVSLGQGQGPIAERLIDTATGSGRWVLLQNCHLAPSWMPALERRISGLDPGTTDPNFRLWLTSYPSPNFPVEVLQGGVKMTNEAPKGIRANLLRSYRGGPLSDEDFFMALAPGDAPTPEDMRRDLVFRKCAYVLCFFHAQIQERRKFGPLGWNIPYEFSQSDLTISLQQLQIYVQESRSGVAPWEALKYVTGECNYGGRVTDAKDSVTLRVLLENAYCEEALVDGYALSESGAWSSPTLGTHAEYVAAIEALPSSSEQLPETFGLHANANIVKDQRESLELLLATVTARSGGGSGAAEFDEDIINATSKDLISKLPPDFKPEYMVAKYPVNYNECLNTVLIQEATRYNGLLSVVRTSSEQIARATLGLVVMSAKLEAMAVSLTLGQVPLLWKVVSFPSIKPLGAFTKDFLMRLEMLTSWYDQGPPSVFWLPGFFFMQSFTSASKQNFARKENLSLDELHLSFEVTTQMTPDGMGKPPKGVLVTGLFLEGASWDMGKGAIAESEPTILTTAMPVIWAKPTHMSEHVIADTDYMCPLYVHGARRGRNVYCYDINLASNVSPNHWVKRGAALLLQVLA